MRTDLLWNNSLPAPTEETIQHVEREVGHSFPEDFRLLLRKHHGGAPDKDTFFVDYPGVGRTGTNVSLLTLEPGLEYVLDVLEWARGQLPSNVIPFGRDGGGDLICFDYREDNSHPRVVYHCQGYPPEIGLLPLADSFTSFLEMLEESPPVPG